MDYSAFKKLLAFFSALKDSGFRRTLKEIPNSTLIRGARTPVDKEFAMKILHAFPEFQSDQFKNDNAIIKYLSDPRNRERILSRFTPNLRRELETQLNEKAGPSDTQMQIKEQAVSDGEQGQPQAGGSAPGGMPALPSAPAMPRMMRNIPHAPETPKPDIAIANSSGHVAEAGDPSKLVSTTSTGQIKEGGEPSKLVTADRTGGIKETGQPSQFITPSGEARGDASKLVSSNGGPLRETPHSAISQGKTISPGRKFNTSFFKSSAGNVFKRVQNFTSPANPFLKTNLNRIGQGFKSMFGNLGNAGGRALMGGLNLGGNTAGRLSGFGSSMGGRIKSVGNRGSSLVKGGGKKFALASVLTFVLFFGLAASGANISPGDAAPPPAPPPAPPGPIVPPVPPPPGLKGISVAAAQITALLYQTNPLSSNLEDRLFHNKRDEPGLYYWCTLIVVDAYNKAGFTGLTRAAHAGVLNMKSFFATTAGYQLLPPETPVEQLREGDVIFFEGSGDQHTSLVKSVEVSQEGNGIIRTFEANNVVLEDIVSVQNHKAISAQTTAKKFKITGFGQVVTQGT